jgi:ankyrin repeat protein
MPGLLKKFPSNNTVSPLRRREDQLMHSSSLGLKRAASEGDLDTVRSLVEAGADVNATDEHGSGTLLTFHPQIIAYLLSKGADPNTQTNENGASVLAGLAYVNEVEGVKILLEHGAEPNRGRSESGETPLHHALAGNTDADRTELIRLLISHGADVNATTKPGVVSFNFWRDARTRGETPLHRAAAYGSIGIIRMILNAGADPMIRDVNGDSPLGWASWHRRPREVIDLLSAAREDPNAG